MIFFLLKNIVQDTAWVITGGGGGVTSDVLPSGTPSRKLKNQKKNMEKTTKNRFFWCIFQIFVQDFFFRWSSSSGFVGFADFGVYVPFEQPSIGMICLVQACEKQIQDTFSKLTKPTNLGPSLSQPHCHNCFCYLLFLFVLFVVAIEDFTSAQCSTKLCGNEKTVKFGMFFNLQFN